MLQQTNNEMFFEAAMNGNTKRIKDLLQGANIDISYKSLQSGLTSLTVAVKGGYYCRIVSLLLNMGADPDEIVFEGYTNKSLLQLAVEANHPGFVKLLLRTGVSYFAIDNNWTSLVAKIKDNKMTELLCAAGLDNTILDTLRGVYGSYSDHQNSNINIIAIIIIGRGKYKDVAELHKLLTRTKELQYEVADMDGIIQIATTRSQLETELNNLANTSPQDYSKIAELGMKLQNQEKLAASYCLLEEDCAALPAKYHTLLADLTAMCEHLKGAHQFEYLKDFATLRTKLEKVDFTPLEAALKDGLLRPAIQLDKPVPLQEPVEDDGEHIPCFLNHILHWFSDW